VHETLWEVKTISDAINSKAPTLAVIKKRKWIRVHTIFFSHVVSLFE
jgi:hypothetical protein